MNTDRLPRRDFLLSTATSLAGLSMISWPNVLVGRPNTLSLEPKIGEVVDLIIAAVPGGKQSETVDTFKSGSPDDVCRGIVTTFMATAEVIQKAADLGANLIITHEPTYYNHLDQVDWLADDPVYQYKKSLIDSHGMAIWRFHDYWHTVRPDGILHGLLKQMGWVNYERGAEESIIKIPVTTLRELAVLFKNKLQLKRPFIVGQPDLACSTVALLPGAWGGSNQIDFFGSHDFDVMVVGEVAEWETSEYIRDATFGGIKRGLIILGHAVSEEPGMQYLVDWLQPIIPGIPVHHVAAQDAFRAV